MFITIIGAEDAEPEALGKVLSRLAYHQHVATATVFVKPREPNGWLEYLLVIKYSTGGGMTIGCIMRDNAPDTKMEFHS